jgi:hypothetical protein
MMLGRPRTAWNESRVGWTIGVWREWLNHRDDEVHGLMEMREPLDVSRRPCASPVSSSS